MLSIGQVVDNRYRINGSLGQGGMGAVYRAEDLRLNRVCAVKENLDPSAEAERQFEKEASILANLNHPNLPRVTDYFIIPGQGQYLVMDFVKGEDLQEKIDRYGAMSVDQVLPWIEKICDALTYLHRQEPPIIHRDLKPANIKIPPGGPPMLVDFGIAKVYDPVLRTTKGARAITPGYSPPEQYGRGRTDIRSDVYGLGATLYALLTGQEPADSVECLIGKTQIKPPRQINGTIPEPVAKSIQKAMAIDPDKRFQSVQAFKNALSAHSSLKPSRQAVKPIRPKPSAAASESAQAFGSASPAIHKSQSSNKVRNLSIATLILGLASVPLSFICLGFFTALLTFITGWLVVKRHSDQATKNDRKRAIIGIIAAAITIIGICVIVAAEL
jgi:serine/threonine protein kinase